MAGRTLAIEAAGLTKRYRGKAALDGVDLQVPSGTVHGLLGPNGAGKTTTVRILSTLTRVDGGRARVAGYDVQRQPRQVRRNIGLTGQQTAVDDLLSARQNLIMFGRLFRLDRTGAGRRADELLEFFGLEAAARRSPKHFSGGMRRRLDLAASMILAPKVLYLDEPTTGLDPAGRREVWQAIRTMATSGTTVLLTTHYLDEADKLCDRISVIDRGRNFVEDTPSGLKRRIGDERLEVSLAHPDQLDRAAALVGRITGTEAVVDREENTVTAPVADGVDALTSIAAVVRSEGIGITDIGVRRPTLDEAFLQLTDGSAQRVDDTALEGSKR